MKSIQFNNFTTNRMRMEDLADKLKKETTKNNIRIFGLSENESDTNGLIHKIIKKVAVSGEDLSLNIYRMPLGLVSKLDHYREIL